MRSRTLESRLKRFILIYEEKRDAYKKRFIKGKETKSKYNRYNKIMMERYADRAATLENAIAEAKRV